MRPTDGRKEVYLSDLGACVAEKDLLAPYPAKNRWECVSYETAEAKGTMLAASSQSLPPPVTISPELEGWYRIYICMGEIGGEGYVDVKLTDDEFPTTVSPVKLKYYCMWTPSENAEEAFWKCADMTGQSITVSKPDLGIPHPSNIFWFRFVPMDEAEAEEASAAKPRGRLFAHMDGDFHMHDAKDTPHDYCKAIYAMKDSDVSIICEEVINDLCDCLPPADDYVARDGFSLTRMGYFAELTKNREAIYKEQISYAHRYGIKLFAGHRMQLSNFAFPIAAPFFHIPFVEANADKTCEARDGTRVDFLSYGYEEVQDFIIRSMLESASFGFDGVLDIWTRGVHLMFERPVTDLFYEKFGGEVDPRTLPEDDPRLMETKSDIIAGFYRRVRNAFADFARENGKEPMKIYVTGCFDVDSSKKEGIDIERLAREGLIDGVIQSKMKHTELTDGTLTDDGRIDLGRYVEKAKHERMYDRFSGSDVDMLVAGTKGYAEIADRYGIDFYTEIQWETYKLAEEYVRCAKKIYSAYGQGISLWDCYPCRVNILSEWAADSRLGDRERVLSMSDDPSEYHRIYKVLSYGGSDVRYANPSWRG